jgi:hypothetical protein
MHVMGIDGPHGQDSQTFKGVKLAPVGSRRSHGARGDASNLTHVP